MPVYVSRQGGRRGNQRRVGQWARVLLHTLGEVGELSVVLCDDPFIRPLNAEWRQRDQATDVLSFPQDGPGGMVLGDVVISVETADRQARVAGHSFEDELRVLLAHGLAHLLGHDHHTPEDAQEMAALEARLLRSLGLDRSSLVHRSGVADGVLPG